MNMIIPTSRDALHKAWLYRLLQAIGEDAGLAASLYFKGGTCASMLGWLPRFSVDLDFDYAGQASVDGLEETRIKLEEIFADLGLSIKDRSKAGLQYFLKYDDQPHGSGGADRRNTIKVEASFPLYRSSKYAPQRFAEIDRILYCQTKETMFAHKLVAPLDRFEKTGAIAGRDIFDIHHFFMSGMSYDGAVIEERRGVPAKAYLRQLRDFIEREATDKVITEDLSFLLPLAEFRRMRKVLKRETLGLLEARI